MQKLGKSISSQEIENAIVQHDIKHDGKISFEEFKIMVNGGEMYEDEQEGNDDLNADMLPEEGQEKKETESIKSVKIT